MKLNVKFTIDMTAYFFLFSHFAGEATSLRCVIIVYKNTLLVFSLRILPKVSEICFALLAMIKISWFSSGLASHNYIRWDSFEQQQNIMAKLIFLVKTIRILAR